MSTFTRVRQHVFWVNYLCDNTQQWVFIIWFNQIIRNFIFETFFSLSYTMVNLYCFSTLIHDTLSGKVYKIILVHFLVLFYYIPLFNLSIHLLEIWKLVKSGIVVKVIVIVIFFSAYALAFTNSTNVPVPLVHETMIFLGEGWG